MGASLLDDPPGVEADDQVGAANRLEPVGDDQGGAPREQPAGRFADARLGADDTLPASPRTDDAV
jgi:hypothetical protein